MLSFPKILIAVMFLLMFSTAWLSSSQGWWWYGMQSPSIMREYKEENATYMQSYRSSGGYTGIRRSGMSSASRSFRSGTTRGSRGK